MRLVVGGGHAEGDIGVVDTYQNNIAILSSGPVSLEAAGLGLARIETAPGAYQRATFFWRNGTTARDLHSVDVPGQGSRWLSLGDLPAWRGHITEVGLMFYAEGDQVVKFHGLDLLPDSLGAHLEKLLRDWLHTSQWSQKSVNWLPAGAESTTLPLPALMGAWVLVMALAAVVLAAARRPGALGTLLISAIAAWALLDLRWSANGLAQARATLRHFPLAQATDLGYGDDDVVRQLVVRARPTLDETGKRPVVMAEDPGMVFQMFRAKYHALPAPVYVHEGPVETLPAQRADSVLVIRKHYAEPGYRPATAADYARVIERRDATRVKPLWEQEDGFMLSLSH